MDKQKKILLIEDNEKLNDINRRALESEGYDVQTASTLAQAREYLALSDPDVILLDVLLPDGNGIDFCAEIRPHTTAHILFLTSRSEHADKVSGLDTGGDDYITKPYKIAELLSRVRSAMRRRDMQTVPSVQENITRGALTLDMASGRAFLDGEDMLLSPKEFGILRLLMLNEGKTLSKEYLFEKVWKQSISDDARALWTHISVLKSKLSRSSCAHSIISKRGEGYQFRYQ